QNVLSTQRGTTIQNDKTQVHTVEHFLAALHALEISDLNVDLNGNEIPILDGSSKPFFDELNRCEIVDLKSEANCIVVEEKLEFVDDETGSQYIITPYNGLAIESTLEYNDPVIGNQSAVMADISEFGPQISSCRTFVMASELKFLYEADLIKGGRPDNALVFRDANISTEGIEKLQKLLGTNENIEESNVLVNNLTLRYNNEPARHKLLDLIGDLYLTGYQIKAKIKAFKPGHTSNFKLAKFLQAYQESKETSKPKSMYDPNAKAIKDVNQIMEMLPHRYPFLMVDKVIELTDKHVVGVKNVSFNENFFQGHFPGNPVFPGVLQMEALAQCGGILALSLSEEGDWDTYFVKMDKVKFRNMVYPGDSLILHMELLMPIKRGIVKMYGKAMVGDKLMSEGELIAKIVKREG
ncbi:UNVERIFIED_CONTAM: hypothetical protein GTU68_013369, partial [Idotea baltica]|nr:hypothetical protein [Idotea baltica]